MDDVAALVNPSPVVERAPSRGKHVKTKNRIITLGEDQHGKAIKLDLDDLIHLLITASTGQGKSETIRALLELTQGVMQQVVLDWEGEYWTLREHHDYLIVGGNGGDVPTDPTTAALLARKVRETGVDTIVDLSLLPKTQRKVFVLNFLRALRSLSREYWTDCLVVIDEAHNVAPQKVRTGDKSATSEEVADFISEGRKRGFRVILATQRLSKIDKDVAGECADKLVGGLNLKDDRARGADELGDSTKEMQQQIRSLVTDKKPGWFYVVGRALPREVTLMHMVRAKSKEPPKGTAARRIPPASGKVAKLLKDAFADLPKEAKEEAVTMEAARREIARLERELSNARKGAPVASAKTKRDPEDAATIKALEAERNVLTRHIDRLEAAARRRETEIEAQVDRARKQFLAAVADVEHAVGKASQATSGLRKGVASFTVKPAGSQAMPERPTVGTQATPAPRVRAVEKPAREVKPTAPREVPAGLDDLFPAQVKLLQTLADLRAIGFTEPSREMMAAFASVKPSSGSFRNNLGALRTRGLIAYPKDGAVSLTEEAAALVPPRDAPATPEAMRERIGEVLFPAQLKLLDVLLASWPDGMTREALADGAGVEAGSGSFRNNLGAMRTMGLIEYPEQGTVRVNDWVLLEGTR